MGKSAELFLETREAEGEFTQTNDFIELKGFSRTLALKDFIIEALQKKINQLKLEKNEK